ncbi:MAG: metallophosphoesterase [Reyranella sp.]|nr:MAG: metallophosphoesterase [Reyranella sp.]
MTIDPDWATARRAMETGRTLNGPDGQRSRWLKAIKTAICDSSALWLRAVGLYARGHRNAADLQLTEIEVSPPGLPAAFDGFRILHVSDTHLDQMPSLVPIARRLLDGIEVDLLALTGDVLGDHHAPVAPSADMLGEVLSGVRVTGRRLAILGNHDPLTMVAEMERIGFEVLVNRSTVIERATTEGGVARLGITGLDDVHYFYSDAARRALEAQAGNKDCRIALIHSADVADWASAAGYALYLAGHTHGGQICLPGGRPVVANLLRCRHAATGLWRDGDMVGYTSTGLGVAYPPVRFNCRGEAAVITLRGTKSG